MLSVVLYLYFYVFVIILSSVLICSYIYSVSQKKSPPPEIF